MAPLALRQSMRKAAGNESPDVPAGASRPLREPLNTSQSGHAAPGSAAPIPAQRLARIDSQPLRAVGGWLWPSGRTAASDRQPLGELPLGRHTSPQSGA